MATKEVTKLCAQARKDIELAVACAEKARQRAVRVGGPMPINIREHRVNVSRKAWALVKALEKLADTIELNIDGRDLQDAYALRDVVAKSRQRLVSFDL